MGMRRGQAAFEFISYFGFFLVVFLLAMVFLVDEHLREVKERQQLLAKEAAVGIADEINFAAAAGPGYSRIFRFPKKIFGSTDYVVEVRPGYVEVAYSEDGSNFTATIPTATSNITVVSPPINTALGVMIVNNTGGRVYVIQ